VCGVAGERDDVSEIFDLSHRQGLANREVALINLRAQKLTVVPLGSSKESPSNRSNRRPRVLCILSVDKATNGAAETGTNFYQALALPSGKKEEAAASRN